MFLCKTRYQLESLLRTVLCLRVQRDIRLAVQNFRYEVRADVELETVARAILLPLIFDLLTQVHDLDTTEAQFIER